MDQINPAVKEKLQMAGIDPAAEGFYQMIRKVRDKLKTAGIDFEDYDGAIKCLQNKKDITIYENYINY